MPLFPCTFCSMGSIQMAIIIINRSSISYFSQWTAGCHSHHFLGPTLLGQQPKIQEISKHAQEGTEWNYNLNLTAPSMEDSQNVFIGEIRTLNIAEVPALLSHISRYP